MVWKRVNRCKECGKIYEKGIPYICRKCGAEIGSPTSLLAQAFGGGPVTLTKKCEKVIAKRGLLGWKVRESEAIENEMSEMQERV